MQNMIRLIELQNAKLSHYNAWLGNPKRDIATVYPGFPEQDELDVLSGLTPSRKAQPKTVVKTVKEVLVSKTGTKLDQAREIFKSMPNATREQVITAFIDKLGMTKAGASTYFYNVKK